MVRIVRGAGAMLVVVAGLAACSSDEKTATTTSTAASISGPAGSSDVVTTTPATAQITIVTLDVATIPIVGVTSDIPGATDGSGDGSSDEDFDPCTEVPDAATIEATIGVAVKEPLGIGDRTSASHCTYLRAADDFPGITFNTQVGGTIAFEIQFEKTNFGFDLVPLDGYPGFYAGAGDSVYFEQDGNLYSTSATIDGDSQTAAAKLMQVWRGV